MSLNDTWNVPPSTATLSRCQSLKFFFDSVVVVVIQIVNQLCLSVINDGLPYCFFAAQFLLHHGFHNHLMELQHILFVWHFFWHNNPPICYIVYYKTNGGSSNLACAFLNPFFWVLKKIFVKTLNLCYPCNYTRQLRRIMLTRRKNYEIAKWKNCGF